MFWNRFYELCTSNGFKPNSLCSELGVSSGTLSTWKKGGSLPNGGNLLQIADKFDCSVDYLLGRTDIISVGGPTGAVILSDDENELIEYFRGCGKIGRRHILTCAENEAGAESDKGEGRATETA